MLVGVGTSVGGRVAAGGLLIAVGAGVVGLRAASVAMEALAGDAGGVVAVAGLTAVPPNGITVARDVTAGWAIPWELSGTPHAARESIRRHVFRK